MSLSKETLELLAEVAELRQTLNLKHEQLSDMISNDTGGMLGVCEPIGCLQLYVHQHDDDGYKIHGADAVERLKDIADDAALEVTWQDEVKTCYGLQIDRVEIVTLVNTEDVKEAEADGNNV